MLDISPVSEALLPQVPAYELKKKKNMNEITASRLIRAKVALLWRHVREDSCCPKEQNRKIEENVLSLLKQKDLKMPDENTFKSAFADANCPKETRSYTLAHLKTKKILRKHAFCELMP